MPHRKLAIAEELQKGADTCRNQAQQTSNSIACEIYADGERLRAEGQSSSVREYRGSKPSHSLVARFVLPRRTERVEGKSTERWKRAE